MPTDQTTTAATDRTSWGCPDHGRGYRPCCGLAVSDATRMPATAARPELPHSVGDTEREWTAMLWDTVSWHPVGTTGDRQHALNEAHDWLRDGIHPEERICIAHRDVGPWWPEEVEGA